MIGRRSKTEWRMIAAMSDPQHTLLPARLVAMAEGYAMVRRRAGALPFVVTEEAWVNAPQRETIDG